MDLGTGVSMQGMRDLMRGSLARSLSTLPAQDRLAAALPLVCGTALASHCEVVGLDAAGTLHIRVTGRDWMAPLQGMRELLRSDLARIAGVVLTDLRFEHVLSGETANTRSGSRRVRQKDETQHLNRSPSPR